MNDRIWQREQDYRRRLRGAAPIAVVVVALLFLASDHISFQEIERHIGWKGELRLMPEITIIPDNDEANIQEQQRKLATMSTIDLDIPEGKDISSPEFVNVERPEEVEQLDFAEFDQYRVRTIETHRNVPYSKEFVILEMVEPKYPPGALQSGIEGSVLVQLLVGQSGNVVSVAVLSRFGPQSFEDSTLAAVRQIVFQPPAENGGPSSMWIKFLVKFRIFS